MKIKQIITTVLSGMVLSSCALLGPDYKKPELSTPQNWSAKDGQAKIESVNMAELAWWTKFNDPQLNGLIKDALANNNNLQMAMGNMLQAQAALKQVNMGWVPSLNLGGAGFTGQAFNQSVSSNAMPLPPLSNTQNFNGYGVGLMPSYTLNVFEQIKQGDIAKLNVKMQEQTVNAVRLGVITQVANSYFTLLGLHKQLELQNKLLSDAVEMRKYNLIQYNQGKISDLMLEGLDQYIASIEANIPMIEADITQAENALQVLTNNNPGKIKLNNTFDNISTDNIVPANLPSTVLRERPDVMGAEYQLQVANANVGAATAMFFPTISLTGMLGQGSMNLTNLFSAGADFWMAQLGAAMPVLNLSLYANIDKAKAGYYTAYYNYVQTVRTAFSQVDNGLATHDGLTKNLKQQLVAVQKTKNLYNIGEKQYKNGVIAYSDTIGYKLNMDYSLAKHNQVKMQQLNSLVNLYQVLGGGYMVESSLTQVKKFNDNHDM